MIKQNFGLFGCKATDKWMTRYEMILVKGMIEDWDFCDRWSDRPSGDLIKQTATLIDILDVVRDLWKQGIKPDYEKLRIEFEAFDPAGVIRDTINELEELCIPEEWMGYCKADTVYWMIFLEVAKFRNMIIRDGLEVPEYLEHFLTEGVKDDDAEDQLMKIIEIIGRDE